VLLKRHGVYHFVITASGMLRRAVDDVAWMKRLLPHRLVHAIEASCAYSRIHSCESIDLNGIGRLMAGCPPGREGRAGGGRCPNLGSFGWGTWAGGHAAVADRGRGPVRPRRGGDLLGEGPGRSLDLALWADRDVVPADWPTRVFTPKQWDALSQPPLDVDERPSLW